EDTTENYANQPIPCDLDGKVRKLVEIFISAPPEHRKVALTIDDELARDTLIAFAPRMAAAGVRENSRQRLLEGLIALIIENYSKDWRDGIIRMAPLYHAAGQIGVDPEQLFVEAASYANNDVAKDLAEFPRRKPEERSLEAMSYRIVHEPDGIRYIFGWSKGPMSH